MNVYCFSCKNKIEIKPVKLKRQKVIVSYMDHTGLGYYLGSNHLKTKEMPSSYHDDISWARDLI